MFQNTLDFIALLLAEYGLKYVTPIIYKMMFKLLYKLELRVCMSQKLALLHEFYLMWKLMLGKSTFRL